MGKKLNQIDVTQLLESIKYGHGKIISKSGGYIVTKPSNTWDTNYRLHDTANGVVYLIDGEDIRETEQQLEEYGGILFQNILNLDMEAVEEIKSIAWKTEIMS